MFCFILFFSVSFHLAGNLSCEGDWHLADMKTFGKRRQWKTIQRNKTMIVRQGSNDRVYQRFGVNPTKLFLYRRQWLFMVLLFFCFYVQQRCIRYFFAQALLAIHSFDTCCFDYSHLVVFVWCCLWNKTIYVPINYLCKHEKIRAIINFKIELKRNVTIWCGVSRDLLLTHRKHKKLHCSRFQLKIRFDADFVFFSILFRLYWVVGFKKIKVCQ